MTLERLSEQRCFGGIQGVFRHQSTCNAAPMRFSVYTPPGPPQSWPVMIFLAGLTCTEETFMIKAGAQALASQLGLMLVSPDTSPRDTGIEGESARWDFGVGAGFYLDAIARPWATHYQMASYVTRELLAVLEAEFGIDLERVSLCGHSMGGHGALTLALKHPDLFRSVSAFAPIVAPTQVPWGRYALPRYLGDDAAAWAAHDSCALLESGKHFPGTLLVDQGESDQFLAEQLRPELLEQACAAAGQALQLRRRPGYDHSYWFIQSFIGDHLRFHAQALGLRA